MRRAAIVVLAAAAGVLAVVAVLAFFGSRDEGSTARPPAAGAPDRRATSAVLRAGNVELLYRASADLAPLVALVQRIGAGDSPALRAAGQAVILRQEPGVAAILARAYRHSLRVRSPTDPRLQDFVESWLGAAGAP